MSIETTREDGVATLVINRPESMNALSAELLEEIDSELESLERDPTARVIVLTGAGDKAFIAGADIRQMADFSPLDARAYASLGHRVATRLETMPKIAIAAVNGYALGGGCEMALACDIRIASTRARFGQPEINLGIMPGWGGTQRLARTTSIGFAKEVMLTGRMIEAEEAFERGMVQVLCAPEELRERAAAMAREIAGKGPIALGYVKEAANQALAGDLHGSLQHEADLFAILFLIFDVEAVFIFPWAVSFVQIGEFAFWSMVVFIGILAFGLAYAWKNGVLQWK